METFKTNQDGTSLRSSIIVTGKGFITGNPNNYRLNTQERPKSFVRPAHFYPYEGDRIVKRLNKLGDAVSFVDLTEEIEAVRLSPEVKALSEKASLRKYSQYFSKRNRKI